MSSVTGAYDSSVQLLVPALQAAATIIILDKQKDLYDDIAEKRIALIDQAVGTYVTGMNALVTTGLVGDAFGSVPDAAEYVPIDSREAIYAAINENLQNVPAAERHIAAVNRMNENNDIVRITAFAPEFLHLAHKNSSTLRDLMNGKLPIDEVINVLTDDAEQAALNGRIGNTARQNHRSLGITRLRMQALARRELEQHVNIAQRVSPVQRQQSIQDMLGNPANRVALALTQAQLIQQSLQNANNADAAGDPTSLGQLQIQVQQLTARLAQEAQRGNLVNQFVPDFASILQPQIKSISEALLGSGDRTGANTGGSSAGVGQSNGKSNYSTDPNSLI
jgi:hypothetical protein